jgi:hypothetical protein
MAVIADGCHWQWGLISFAEAALGARRASRLEGALGGVAWQALLAAVPLPLPFYCVLHSPVLLLRTTAV